MSEANEILQMHHNSVRYVNLQEGPMPWRLQIAARLMAGIYATGQVTTQTLKAGCDLQLAAADALIAAHEATKGGSDGED